jgi:hypothetical protein
MNQLHSKSEIKRLVTVGKFRSRLPLAQGVPVMGQYISKHTSTRPSRTESLRGEKR